MQDNNTHIDPKPDVFSEVIKNKLENYQLPVDADLWDAIEKTMASKKRRIIPFWLWIPLGSAALIALIFTIHPFSESKPTLAKLESNKIEQKKEVSPKQPVKKTLLSMSTGITKTNNRNIARTTKQPAAYSIDTENWKEASNSSEVNMLDSAKNALTNQTLYTAIPVSKSDSAITQNALKNPTASLPTNNVYTPVIKTKNRSNLLIAASVGSGNGFQSNGFGGLLSSMNDKTIGTTSTNYTETMASNNFSNIDYQSPVSVGFSIRKNLNKTLSLETGLVYTYLLTTFNNSIPFSTDVKLNLNYLGVPLNLVAKLWANPKWEVYLSGGGMIEKGIRSVSIQHQYFQNQTISTTTSTDIAGYQWSINGGLGVSYKIQRNIGVFFEPKISYFFDNKQPTSIRTKQPTVVGLNIGVRYEIK